MAQILLLEPDRVLASAYCQAMQREGNIVTICSSAQSAITAADTLQPDIVILELQLIEHSGIEFLYEFRSYPEWRDIPVIILSAVPPTEFGSSRDMLMKELGVRIYHYKPQTSLHNLLASINSCKSLAA